MRADTPFRVDRRPLALVAPGGAPRRTLRHVVENPGTGAATLAVAITLRDERMAIRSRRAPSPTPRRGWATSASGSRLGRRAGFRDPKGEIVQVERLDNRITGRVVLGRDLPVASAQLAISMQTRMARCRAGLLRPASGPDVVMSLALEPRR